jgi:heme O synthase-like polyprenyltransferase
MLPGEKATSRQILISALLLIPVSLAASGGMVYSIAALVLGLAYFGAAARAASQFTRRRAHQLLLASVTYLPALYVFLLFGKR